MQHMANKNEQGWARGQILNFTERTSPENATIKTPDKKTRIGQWGQILKRGLYFEGSLKTEVKNGKAQEATQSYMEAEAKPKCSWSSVRKVRFKAQRSPFLSWNLPVLHLSRRGGGPDHVT